MKCLCLPRNYCLLFANNKHIFMDGFIHLWKASHNMVLRLLIVCSCSVVALSFVSSYDYEICVGNFEVITINKSTLFKRIYHHLLLHVIFSHILILTNVITIIIIIIDIKLLPLSSFISVLIYLALRYKITCDDGPIILYSFFHSLS